MTQMNITLRFWLLCSSLIKSIFSSAGKYTNPLQRMGEVDTRLAHQWELLVYAVRSENVWLRTMPSIQSLSWDGEVVNDASTCPCPRHSPKPALSLPAIGLESDSVELGAKLAKAWGGISGTDLAYS